MSFNINKIQIEGIPMYYGTITDGNGAEVWWNKAYSAEGLKTMAVQWLRGQR